jgi:flagellar assembly protein FliH
MARGYAPLRDFSARALSAAQEPQDTHIGAAEVERLVARAAADAHASGVREGREAAMREAADSLAAVTNGLLQQLRDQVEAEQSAVDERIADIELRTVRLLLALIRKLTTDMNEGMAEAHAIRLAREVVESSHMRSRLEIRVAPELAPALREALSGPMERRSLDAATTVIPDPAVAHGAVSARWSGGSVAFDPAERQRRIDALVERALTQLSSPAEGNPS